MLGVLPLLSVGRDLQGHFPGGICLWRFALVLRVRNLRHVGWISYSCEVVWVVETALQSNISIGPIVILKLVEVQRIKNKMRVARICDGLGSDRNDVEILVVLKGVLFITEVHGNIVYVLLAIARNRGDDLPWNRRHWRGQCHVGRVDFLWRHIHGAIPRLKVADVCLFKTCSEHSGDRPSSEGSSHRLDGVNSGLIVIIKLGG